MRCKRFFSFLLALCLILSQVPALSLHTHAAGHSELDHLVGSHQQFLAQNFQTRADGSKVPRSPTAQTLAGDGVDYVVQGTLEGGCEWAIGDDYYLYIWGDSTIPTMAADAYPWSAHKDLFAGVIMDAPNVPDNAFDGCSQIVYVYLESGVTAIGSRAFADCVGIQELMFIGHAPTIAENAFANVFTYLYYHYGDSSFDAVKDRNYGGHLFWNYWVSPLDSGMLDTVEWAVYEDMTMNLYGVGYPMTSKSSPQEYPWYQYVGDLLSLETSSVTTIGDYAFSGCGNMKSLYFDDSLYKIGEYAFNGIQAESLPLNCVEVILDGAFENATNVESLEFYYYLAQIGSRAFAGCTSLESIAFTGGSPVIGENAFQNVEATVTYSSQHGGWNENLLQNYGGSLTWVEIVDAVASGSVGDISWILTDDGVLTLEGSESSMVQNDFPWNNYNWDITEVNLIGVTHVAQDAFTQLHQLETVVFGDSVAVIGTGAFQGCENLKALYFEGYPPALGENVFPDHTFTIHYPDNGAWTPEILAQFQGSSTDPDPTPNPGPGVGKTPDCSITQDQVYEILISMQEQYPEGMGYTNADFYEWQGGTFSGGYGCAAFAFILSDAAFGTIRAEIIATPSFQGLNPVEVVDEITIEDLRVGDILRTSDDTHSVVVLEVHDDHIVVAEGNFNYSVHWGRVISAEEIRATGDYIMTRYPEHQWQINPEGTEKTCSVCGRIESTVHVHTWNDATCTAPKTCTTCGAQEGEPLEHSWKDATCFVAQTCDRCGLTQGQPLGHAYDNGVCTRCGASMELSYSGLHELPVPTKEEIAQVFQTVTSSQNIFLVEPSVTAPYAAGTLTQEFLSTGTTMLNYIRFVARLNEVMISDSLMNTAQHGAVVLAANDILTHYPSQPTDMPDDFFSLGYKGTSTSNIHFNWGYSAYTSLQTALHGFMDDDGTNNLASVGHRRWVLNPRMLYTGFGYAQSTGKSNYVAMSSLDQSRSYQDYTFLGWPAGNFPYDLFPTTAPWSVSLNPKLYQTPVKENLSITLTRHSDGKTWSFDGNTPGPQSNKTAYLTVCSMGYGSGPAIIFHPGADNLPSSFEGVYQVQITGLYSASGEPATLSYEVDFFDVKNYTSTEHTHDWTFVSCDQPRVCSVCGESEGSAPGHAWDSGVVTQEPGYDEPGVKTFTCQRCGGTKTEDIEKLTGIFRKVDKPDPGAGRIYTALSAATGEQERIQLDIPKDGATVLVFFSTQCGNCHSLFEKLNLIDWMENPYLNFIAMAVNTGDISPVQSFRDEITPLIKDHIDYYSIPSPRMDFDYFSMATDDPHTYYYPMVIVLTGDSENATVRYASDQAKTVGHLYYALRSASPAFAAYDDNGCAHEWQDATCEQPITCAKCGATEGEALGHKWDAATCEKPKTCSACGETEGEALGHKWDAATCEKPKTCSVCGKTEGKPAEHKWDNGTVTKPATESAEGVMTYRCTACGKTRTEPIPKLDHVHDYKSKVTAPTCEDQGFTTHTCQCGHSYVDTYVPAKGHSWNNATCDKAKTCTVCGKTEGSALGHKWNAATCDKAKTCSVCGKTEGSALGHKWNAATCDKAKTCSVCGKTEGSPLGHKWNAATCDKAKTCSVCGKTEGSPLGHKWNAATCDKAKTCSVCGKTEGSPLGHKWNAATCDKAKTCSVCGKTEGKALGHSWKNATCQAPKTCTRCALTEGSVAPHSYQSGKCIHCGQAQPALLMWGDANEDKVIDFKDAIGVLEHYVETKLLRPEVEAVCDLFKDGTVDFKDAIWILEIYVETRPDPNLPQ